MEWPDWYWNGLADAKILSITLQELDYDYAQRYPIRNCLTIALDARQAMYDMTVENIMLYNAKILSGDISLSNVYWFDDKLTTENGKYVLEIQVKAHREKHHSFKIKFESAEVIRTLK